MRESENVGGEVQRLREHLAHLRTNVVNMERVLEEYERSERALRESEERFRMLVERVSDYAIFMLDPAGQIVSWNAGAERIKGYTAQEIIGQHFSRFYPEQDRLSGKPARALDEASDTGRYEETGWRVRKDGSHFWANVLITALYDDQGQLRGFAKITRDMTEHKQAEEQLRQSEERFRLLVDSVKDYAIFMLDPGGRVISWNAGAERIKGYTAQEIIGQHFSRFYPEAERASGRPEQELAVATATGRYEEEGWRVRKDGARFWANIVLTPVYDPGGVLLGFAKISRDMSERKQMEEERDRLYREAREAVRLRDEFLNLAAHELKTPTTTILGSLQLHHRQLLRNPRATDAERARAQVMVDQGLRLQRLINTMLDLSRIHDGRLALEYTSVDLSRLVQQIVEEYRPTLSQHEIALELCQERCIVECDALRIEQVLQNLLQNAIKYSPQGGEVQVRLAHEQEQVRLAVSDQGIGIPAVDVPHIFERFYRAHNLTTMQWTGMGIGLYLVKEIVSLHGGHVTVESVDGAGSTFTISLPATRPVAHTRRAEEHDGLAVV